MRVDIYRLRRDAKGWVMDERHPVAVITVKDGQGGFYFYDKGWEKSLRKLFNEPATAFRGGGKTPDGASFDAFVTYPAWTREAVELIVSDILYGHSLGGRTFDNEASVFKSSFISRHWKVLLGCTIGLILCCLTLALAVGIGKWYKASMVSRVEKVVQTSLLVNGSLDGATLTFSLPFSCLDEICKR